MSINLKIPEHIAFIMDGNGRWALNRGLPRNAGHHRGMKAFEKTVDACCKYGIKYVTFYAFSTENWKREKQEIDGIFSLVRDYLKDNPDYFSVRGIRVKHIGDIKPFPKDLILQLRKTEKATAKNNKMVLTLALNYGGRDEIVRAFNIMLNKGKKIDSYADIARHLYTHFLPDPDFVIRTSGENRLSNFMMLQLSYSELYFPKVLWPDFNEKQLVKALKVYSKRDRRFGGVK